MESTGAPEEGTGVDDGEPRVSGAGRGGGDDGRGGRDPLQALAAALVVVALLGAAALVPAVDTSLGLDLSAGTDPTGDDGDTGTAPGALTPDSRTGVGGSLGDAVTNRSDTVHFTVEADRATYWRTAAYGRYTGRGWTRDRDSGERDSPVVDAGGERLQQTVTLNTTAGTVPAAWRPVRVVTDDGTVQVTPDDAVGLVGAADPGTTVQVVSRLQDATPEELAAAGRSYPSSVRRYTRLPETTPARLGEFTAELTRGADSPYETARAVELWLERNKTYALDADHDRSAPVADQFVFEMERGYCEYFATAMVAMLRSQDVPARYVVGYAPGRSDGDGRYEVRSVDAHAWVEVYFPGHGWVRFDPTPAADRRAAERRTLGGDRRPTVPGSPGDDRPDAGLDPEDRPELVPERVPPPPYDLSLNATPVPGRPVAITVTKRDRPVEGVVVTVDGDRVGRTDRNGEVVVRVPYADAFAVDARPPEDAATETETTATVDAVDSGPSAFAATGGPSWGGPTGVDGEPDTQDDGETSREYDTETDVDLSVADGVFAPGRTAVLVATVDGVPLRGVDVRVADATIGRTDDDGRVRLTVPENLHGETTVRLERGGIGESVSLALADLEVSVRPGAVVLLPGVEATARVTVGDRPVEGARVYRDGQPVGVTDRDGTVDLRLPVADAARLRAAGPYLQTTTRIDGLLVRLGGLAAGGVALLGAGALLFRRHASTAGAITAPARLLALLGRLRGRSPLAVSRRAGVRLVFLGGGGLLGAIDRTRATARRGLAALRSPVAAVGGLLARLRRLSRGAVESRPVDDGAPSSTSTEDAAPQTVRAAWRSFVGLLSVPWRRARRMTPAELARLGVRRGLPRGPVEWLRDAYRDAEFGGHDPPGGERVTAALDRLRRAAPDGGDASEPDTGTDGDAPGTGRPDDAGGDGG